MIDIDPEFSGCRRINVGFWDEQIELQFYWYVIHEIIISCQKVQFLMQLVLFQILT